jgi:biotin--protein ligase
MKLKFFMKFFSFVSLAPIECAAELPQQKTVFIYSGPGVSQESFKQVELAIKRMLSDSFTVEKIDLAQVLNDPWEERAALFVLPGGADIPYTQALNGLGNQKIRNYVTKGGAFLGICAGSYYAGRFVDFAKDTPLEVQGERELALFPGVVRGPVLAPYDYFSQSGARAAQLIWSAEEGFVKGELFTVFYNGGGYFVGASGCQDTSVLAFYDTQRSLPAIIQCQVGQGTVILSGVHFEYNPFLLDSQDPYLQKILPAIFRDNEHRELLLKHLLERLLDKIN